MQTQPTVRRARPCPSSRSMGLPTTSSFTKAATSRTGIRPVRLARTRARKRRRRPGAAYDGCEEASTPLDEKVDVDAGITSATGLAETSVAEWKGCTSGAAVQLWTIPDGGHMPTVWSSFADTVLGFFLDHPKP